MDLTSFDISPERGFLPRCDPLATLPRHWPAVLNDLAQALPKLLAARQFRPYVDALRESWSNSLGKRDPDEVMLCLHAVAGAEEQMHHTLRRMPERCDPYIYYNRVRPYIHGWKDNPTLPRGVVYDGVEDFQGATQHFRGETGAQSSIIPALDAAFGVSHAEDPLRQYLAEMRDYMPPKHRAFIETVEGLNDASGKALLYGYVRERRERHPKLWEAFRH